jgi:hypothetical protein
MTDREVAESLERLKSEIERLEGPPAEARAHLEGLVSDIERRLAEEDEAEHGLLEALREGVERFEVEHPRASAILNDILVKLQSMGI